MSPVALLDLISVLGFLASLILLFKGWNRVLGRDAKLFLAGLLLFLTFYTSCLFVEWSGISRALDAAEDFVGALLPMWAALVLYALSQEILAQNLRVSEERSRNILNAVQAGIVIIDPETHTIVDVNPEGARLIGASKGQILSRECHKHICPAEKGQCPITDLGQKLDRAQRLLVRADGRTVPVLKTVVSVVLGGREYLLESFLDITEHKKAEDALRGSEEKYRSLVESTEDSVYLVDRRCSYLFMNKRHLSRLNLSEDDIVGKAYGDVHSKEDTEAFSERVNEVFQDSKSCLHDYTSQKDGKYFLRTLCPVKGAEGRTVAVTVVSKDVSELKRLEVRLQQAQKMEAIGTLAGGIAHNFNNLLMGIGGYVSLIAIELGDGDSIREKLKKIEKLVESGTQLTSSLLGYAREGRYEVRVIDLNALVRETAETFGITKKEMRIHTQLDETLLGIQVDYGQIEQVLWNLLVNAADAMPGGGDCFLTTANVTHENMKGKLYIPKPGNYVELTMTDTGTGMEEKTLKRVFDPFFTTKGVGRGTGLGLASAYGIIKAHGGYIEVESELGKGTTFQVYLPASEKEARETEQTPAEVSRGVGTILLIDDEPFVLDVGKGLLERMGYRVLTATDGPAAVEIFEKQQNMVDMVLLDMIMPGMDGGEVFDRLREINAKVKVLLSSGFSVDGKASHILARGCDGFIQKPFNAKGLSAKVKQILGRE
jgi:two-component system cell cycle sensor histidine kinase/response regulator CckA